MMFFWVVLVIEIEDLAPKQLKSSLGVLQSKLRLPLPQHASSTATANFPDE